MHLLFLRFKRFFNLKHQAKRDNRTNLASKTKAILQRDALEKSTAALRISNKSLH